MVYYMELSQGQIIQKPNKQELSFLFMTHHLMFYTVLSRSLFYVDVLSRFYSMLMFYCTYSMVLFKRDWMC